MDVSYLLDDLNEAQRQAVAAPPSNQLVLAGAGSGKTRVLVHRIAWLLQVEGVSPHEIMAVTFTNKAAKEMRERLQNLMTDQFGYGGLRAMWVGTFHGIAHRFLKAHWREAGLSQNFQIMDSDDQLRVVKRVYDELDIDETRWPYKQSQWFINGQKDEGLRPQHIVEGRDPFLATMKMVYHAYEEACKRGGMVDFAELLLRSHELWLKEPRLLQHYQERFRFLLVDEFQDTNAVQYAWLRVLAGQTGCVTAVGDDDQSIYGWRGARIENIQQYSEDFQQVETTKLEQNYRSTSNILNAANAVIENNNDRLGKSLWTAGKDGELIDLYSAFNDQDEARYIVERIKDRVDKGSDYSSCAILYRSNAQSRVLEEAFLRQNIPYRIYGGQRFYERMEIKNALAYMRLINNRNDDTAFERVINTPTRGVGSKTLESIRVMARDQGVSLYEALVGAIANQVFTARASNALKNFVQLLDQLQAHSEEATLAEMAELAVRDTGLYEFHQKEKGERGQARLDNLEELITACGAFHAQDDALSPLQEFLDNASLDAGDAQAEEFEDAVQMMTLHSAKGLEFPLVFLAGVEENLFPHRMSIDEPGRLSEERRLCYVGITRAMEKLVITCAETRRLNGSDNFNAVSRFVREIPASLIQEVRLKSSVARPSSYSNSSTVPHQSRDADPGKFKLGQRVFHQKFGDGVILQFEGQGPRTVVVINFSSEGTKRLMLDMAKLEAM